MDLTSVTAYVLFDAHDATAAPQIDLDLLDLLPGPEPVRRIALHDIQLNAG